MCKNSDVIIWTGVSLREWRKRLGWTQERLAKELGVSRPTVSSWEKDPNYIPRIVYLAAQTLDLLPKYRRYGNDGVDTFGGNTDE